MALEDLLTRAVSPFANPPCNPILVQSWVRSESAGIARDTSPVFRRIPDSELHQRQAANRTLRDVAIPHLDWMSRWFNQRPHVAYLVDRDGIVLHAAGDADAMARYCLSPGFDWSESQMGTNGAGTALAAGVPVAVIGCDHWSTSWRDATCLGAPIVGRHGALIGAIDMSMDVRDGDAERLVVAAHVAHTISQEVARREAEAESLAKDDLYETVRAALEAERRAHAEAEAALARERQSEHWLRTIIDSTAAVVYVVDDRSRFLMVNRRFTETFAVNGAAAGRSLYDCFPAEVADQFAANNRKVLQVGGSCEFEEIAPHPDGPHTYLTVKAPLYDAEGVPYAICGVSTDITERKRLVAALELAQRQKDAAIATMAHELRQPLGAIQASLALMRARVSRHKGERARTLVERQVRQLARLVEDLLDASRITQGAITLRREQATLNGIIEAAIYVVQPLIRDRGLDLHVEAAQDTIALEADAQRLQQVFSNLLTNAAKFTEPGGRITLTLETGPEAAVVRVRDTGRGIPPDALPYIFDLFAQASPDERGMGIGLAVVRGVVEGHGGTVEAHSNGPGHGSEFIVRLPIAAATT